MDKKKFIIKVFNNISDRGLNMFPEERYIIDRNSISPDIILLRSENLKNYLFPDNLIAIARAGAGTNNIPVTALTKLGIPVFNTPGANANAVKELVLAGLLIAARNLIQASNFINHLNGNDNDVINKSVESAKKDFIGFELPGKTLGILGLGAIGVQVANMALELGMDVIGFDENISVDRAWQLSSGVKQAKSIQELFSSSEIISLHIPSNDKTKGVINSELLSKMKRGSIILNFARGDIVNNDDIIDSIDSGLIDNYVSDFPDLRHMDNPKIISLPHLGASTLEAEENCSIMAVKNIIDFVENGNIHLSVNFPEAKLTRKSKNRLVITNSNIPNMVGQVSTSLADSGINIADLVNVSRNDIAITIIDIDGAVDQQELKNISSIEGVLSVRLLEALS
ncbi:MAG: 3-phosphoglycerate dehydrogenase [Gammaproteobacteria bacterium TMED78]|mgnify:FL=1|nr:MAG: 3-phosphoglycerate dehydrogenase [Gammaproteobacteria bacterium TMED78]|tara:strand:- start:18140 stop:19330 length:1191 start_codon:yes stop_codon:yes gene_type:complete